MKRSLWFILFFVSVILSACYTDEIDEIKNRLDEIESTHLKSQQEQINSILSTISQLENTDIELKKYIQELQAASEKLKKSIDEANEDVADLENSLKDEISNAKSEVLAQLASVKSEMEAELEQINTIIANLQSADLESKIADLLTYIDAELAKSKNWTYASFATLEQYSILSGEVATIKVQINLANESIADLETRINKKISADIATATAEMNAAMVNEVSAITSAYSSAISKAKGEIASAYASAISAAISDLETSMKSWVSEQLSGYYTIAEIDAMIQAKESELDLKFQTQQKYFNDQISSLSTELKGLISANGSLIECLRSDIATVQNASVAENASKIAENAAAISENTQNIIDNASAIVANTQGVKDNTDLIAANKSTIENNNRLISENATAISQLKSSADAAIAENAGNVAANARNIAFNAESIAKNATAINNNAQSILENSNDILQLYQQLASARVEITEAYTKAIEDAIKNDGVMDETISASLAGINTRIDDLAGTINASLTDIEQRLDAVEYDIANLMTRIQSISYVPIYTDGKATLKYCGSHSQVTLDFEVSPKSAIQEISKIWQTALSVKAIYTETRSASFVDMPVVQFESDEVNGVISVTASGENLSQAVLNGSQTASVRLSISDGNSSIISDYIALVSCKVEFTEVDVPNNQIWYTNNSTSTPVTPYSNSKTTFGAKMQSNTYDYGMGCWVMTFDNPVMDVGEYAFYNCMDLVKVKLPDSVTTVGRNAFYGCTGIEEVNLGEGVVSIGDYAFNGCTAMVDIYAGSKLTEIGEFSFKNCDNLVSVDIPDSVTKIGDSAFWDCDNLLNVNLGSGLTMIDLYAFGACKSLATIRIPESVKTIRDGAFNSCFKLTKLYCESIVPPSFGIYMSLPANVTIYVPAESVEEYRRTDGWREYAGAIVGYDFSTGNIVTETHPNNEIWYTSSDGKIVSPNKTESFNVSVASNTYSNGKGVIKFNGKLTEIGAQAFRDCTTLASVILPEDVEGVGTSAFNGCTALKYAKLGKNITKIENYSFYGCSALKVVYCMALNPPTLGYYAFDGNDSSRKICVPAESISSYKSANVWSTYYSLYLVEYDLN